MADLEYRPVILHVSHGSARGDVSLGGASELSLATSMDALAEGLRKMYRTDATPGNLFGELLAKLGDLEHVAAMHEDPVQRYRAMLCDQIARADRAEAEARQLRRELDAARGRLEAWETFRAGFQDLSYHHSGMGCGIEDRGITDRYKACEYGWDEAMDRVAEWIPEEG